MSWLVRLCQNCDSITSTSRSGPRHCPHCLRYLTGEPFQVVRPFLEGSGQARRSDPATAKAAGAIKVQRGTQRWKVLEGIRAAGEHGATSWELVESTGIPYTSLTPRIGELKRAGLVVATDKRRLSDSGVQQEVLVVAGHERPAFMDVDEEDE